MKSNGFICFRSISRYLKVSNSLVLPSHCTITTHFLHLIEVDASNSLRRLQAGTASTTETQTSDELNPRRSTRMARDFAQQRKFENGMRVPCRCQTWEILRGVLTSAVTTANDSTNFASDNPLQIPPLNKYHAGESQEKTCCFMKLPLELRLDIYGLVFERLLCDELGEGQAVMFFVRPDRLRLLAIPHASKRSRLHSAVGRSFRIQLQPDPDFF